MGVSLFSNPQGFELWLLATPTGSASEIFNLPPMQDPIVEYRAPWLGKKSWTESNLLSESLGYSY